jgi:hypothetical protein
MKKIHIILLGACLLLSCKEDVFLYKGARYVQFEKDLDHVTNVSFVYRRADVTRDTAYITVELLGDPVNEPLSFDLVQVEHARWEITYDDFGDVLDSIAIPILQSEENVHHEPLDKTKMVIPPRALSVAVPVVFLRAPSLAAEDRFLRLRVIPGEGLREGTINKLENIIMVADQLVKPSTWNDYSDIFGAYSRVKHRLMVDVSGLRWDDDTFAELLPDIFSFQYYIDRFNEELERYEQEHGMAMLDENNEPVYFIGSGF